jgi:peptide/nickel transport system substrate-binding protein
MRKVSWRRAGRFTALATAVAALAFSGTSLASAKSVTSGENVATAGGTATFALPPQTIPNYIFPLMPPQDFTIVNGGEFQDLMYRPLYFFGVGADPVINTSLSLAYPPVWSANGRSVLIRLKNYKWSNGTSVTARDIQFWQNLVTANKQDWGAYVPGDYPDNVVATKVISRTEIRFTFNAKYSHHWVLYNELSQITPLPLAWDKTSRDGAAGHADRTPGGARAVYKFLAGQASERVSSYGSNPLWRIVDGPWRLQSLSSGGKAVFLPNASYSGPVKPRLAKFVEVPFNNDSAELKALRSGAVTFGYVSQGSPGLRHKLKGYNYSPWTEFGIDYIQVNQHNPTVGSIFRQAYVRRALEELLNQGPSPYTSLTCGPVPVRPPNAFVSSYEKRCPFTYDPAKAALTLRQHGWHVVPGGVSSCARPGSKSSECGPGVAKGARLELNYMFAAGDESATAGVISYRNVARKYAGIKFTLKGTTFNNLIAAIGPCDASQASCTWQIADYGGWVYLPDYYPTGEELFATGALGNLDNYSSARMDRLIRASQLAGNDLATLKAYEDYATSQVPVLWNGTDLYALAEIRSNLRGVTFDPYLSITPEDWYFTKAG